MKEVHSGFQLLNLKNDGLRRRSDGIKYNVRRVKEETVPRSHDSIGQESRRCGVRSVATKLSAERMKAMTNICQSSSERMRPGKGSSTVSRLLCRRGNIQSM